MTSALACWLLWLLVRPGPARRPSRGVPKFYSWLRLRLRLSTAAAETFYGWLRLMNSTAAYGGGSGAYGPSVSRTRNLLVTSPILYQLDHCTHTSTSGGSRLPELGGQRFLQMAGDLGNQSPPVGLRGRAPVKSMGALSPRS